MIKAGNERKKMTAGRWRKRIEALFLKIPRTKFLARMMARLSRLSKRYRKEPQDISKRKRAILMPFHPPLNHDVYNHMEKIQPILSARFRVPPRPFFDSKSHSKLSARDGRRKDREPIVPVMYSAFATFWRRWPSTTTETFTPHRQGGGGPFVKYK